MAKTNAERQAAYRARMKASGQSARLIWLPKKLETPKAREVSKPRPNGAAVVARERFLKYVDKKLAGKFDTALWEFWTFLLKKAESHRIDVSGYASPEYQEDRETARQRRRKHC